MSRAFQHVTLAPAATTNGHVYKGRKTSVDMADIVAVNVGELNGVTTSKNGGSIKTQQKRKGRSDQTPAVSNRDYIEAIKLAFPPERINELLEIAIKLAIETKSWRGVVAASEFAANYSLGKPVKRVESTGDSSLADLLAGVDTSKPLMSGPAKDTDETDE